MTAPSHPKRAPVTQEDREAAARYERLTCPPVAEVIVNGDADDMQLVQFFARHAQAAREAENARVISVARHHLRLVQGCLECNADDERRWSETIAWLESLA